MADLKDERGNPIYLTDEHGKTAQLMDEFGNAMHLTGVATTVPHLKESSYTGPHPITAPITTTNTPHHAQPISVSHDPLQHHDLRWFGTNYTEEDGDEGVGRKSNITDETKSKPSAAHASGSGSVHEPHEKKGFFKKIKEKLTGGHRNDM
ncbi:PREDICTED: late embryogenesis abundant protein-like [Camelina sativa]|uniref:Late embryogenesis abundant protein-like n=1 Tax=Camelina sativa TaxID=90675 RepID=A0ABM0U779_CAMSA|nr:PREDICTED: late embryogenesis abundant protein-like [Camelina sativa]